MNSSLDTRAVAAAYVDALEARDWGRPTDLLAEDIVYEMPQTRERIRGRGALLQFNVEYPGDWHLSVRRLVADGPTAAILMEAHLDGETQEACVWLELSDQGRITRIVDYWPEPYEPPTGREHLVERW